jgi:hypothetical protein
MRDGPGQGCRLKSSGNVQPRSYRSREICNPWNDFTQRQQLRETSHYSRYLETLGNGLKAHTHPTLATEPQLAHLANTTASLCAINSCCVGVPALPRSIT